ncbi:RRQRL motif-containing zinc-binding protein [Micromonospora sp. NPDC049799]|uniref:RRQRL motif-containing zinc-binding protein n=1 Tax=Micromonospora sp. NPDC049799 TaxID=3154741 RepID=UPI0033D07573
MTDLRSVDLDALADRTAIRVEFYDPLGTRYGFPTFPYRAAPNGLATRRQLRAAGLRPGGHDPVAQILWRHRTNRRVAYLYRLDLAAPKRVATPAQREAIAKALKARRTCRHCGQVKPYYIPRRYGCCLDCHGGH